MTQCAECERLSRHLSTATGYAADLQRIIEAACRARPLPEDTAHLQHHKMAADFLDRLKSLEEDIGRQNLALRKLKAMLRADDWLPCDRLDAAEIAEAALGPSHV